MLHRVVERVCLPAGSTVTHDFTDWVGNSKVAGSLETHANDRLQTPWNLLVNRRRRVDHYHLRQETNFPVVLLAKCDLRARIRCRFDDTGRYRVWKKARQQVSRYRSLSIYRRKPAFDRKP